MALYFYFQPDPTSGVSPQQQPYKLNGKQMNRSGHFL